MKKVIFKRHLIFNSLLNLVLLLVMIFSSHKIYSHLTSPFSIFDGKKIAVISQTSGLVQKTSTHSKNPSLLHKDSLLVSGDAVETNGNSFCQLKTFSTLLSLNENTKVEIYRNNGKNFVNYVKGELFFTSGTQPATDFLLAGEMKIRLKEESEIEIYTEKDFSVKNILTIKKGCAEIFQNNSENPLAQPDFLLPPKLLKPGESIVIR